MPATPQDSLEGKVEAALVALLADAGLEDLFGPGSVTLYFGQEFEERVGHSIAVECVGGPEIVYRSGNRLERTKVLIKSPADRKPNETLVNDPRENHRALVNAFREAFGEESAADLTAQEADFTCNLVIDAGTDSGVEGRFFWTIEEFDIDCVRAKFD